MWFKVTSWDDTNLGFLFVSCLFDLQLERVQMAQYHYH